MISPEFTGPNGLQELRAWLAWLEAFQTVSNGEPSVE